MTEPGPPPSSGYRHFLSSLAIGVRQSATLLEKAIEPRRPSELSPRKKQRRDELPSPLVGEGGRRPGEGVVRARALRRRSTDAEIKLWQLLRDRRLSGFKFRRQVPIGRYVADFACFEATLVVELDGSQHAGSASDEVRDAELARRGFEVLRIWNNDLLRRRDNVLETVWAALQRRTGVDHALG